ncbi:P-loop NTPase fold protein [Methanobrevibacter olleyae]|uniref:KAP family P-loop protein n=1 Tax=Methanobrevibacter olleyae TaxID=294671 RepID=A0A126R1H4_METOL|nr:P-loop NTPase fold protein [Methanobrevibacter olleyae]AMK15495.1 KAP family P-loop protein [Methanobrevibacter olleyae]
MYNDAPINERSEDKLHRMNFVDSLAKSIRNYSSNDCIVIGLMGKWGSGKSSIINLLESEIKEDICILRFNPWNYPSQNMLISSFFDELTILLDKLGIDEKVKIYLSKYKSKILDNLIDLGSTYVLLLKHYLVLLIIMNILL